MMSWSTRLSLLAIINIVGIVLLYANSRAVNKWTQQQRNKNQNIILIILLVVDVIEAIRGGIESGHVKDLKRAIGNMFGAGGTGVNV